MILRKKVVTIPLGSEGMDSSNDPKIHQGVIQVINGNYDTNGMISKREGSAEDVAVNDQNRNLAVHKEKVIVWGKDAYSWDGSSLNTISNDVGVLDVERSGTNLAQTNITFQCDYVELDNIYAISYGVVNISTSAKDDYGLYVETFDKETDKQIAILQLQDEDGADNNLKMFCRLVKLDNTDEICYVWPGQGSYPESGIIDNAGAIAASGDLDGASDIIDPAHRVIDACYCENDGVDGYLVVVYPDGTSLDDLNINVQMDGITAWDTEQISTLGYKVQHVSVWRANGNDFCAGYCHLYVSGATHNSYQTVAVREIDSSGTSSYGSAAFIGTTVASAHIRNITGGQVTDKRARCYVTKLMAPNAIRTTDWLPYIYYIEFDWSGGGAPTTTQTETIFQQLSQVAIKPVMFDDTTHILGTYNRSWGTDLTAQDQLLLLDDDGNIVGRSLVGIARDDEYGESTQWDAYSTMPQLQKLDGYEAAVVFPWISRLSLDDSQQSDKFRLAKLDLTWMSNGNSYTETPDATVLSNSMPYEYNGAEVKEVGFPMYPEPLFGAPSAIFGAMENDGEYKYVAVFEETDKDGIIHRSAPTPTPLEITMGGSDIGVNVLVPIFPARRANAYTALYRTVDGGTEYYRVFSIKNTSASTNYVNIADGLADSVLTDNEPLYTDTGELENIAPRGHRVSAIWQNRYVYVDREYEDTTLYYSKLFVNGFGMAFHGGLSFRVNNDGGRVTALFPFSNKLIIFKKRRIYATSGNGFDNLGGGYNFNEPWMVSPSVGCIDQNSLVRTPNGVMFQSERGVWLITQNEQLIPIGEPIKQTSYDSDWSITGTGTIHNRNQAVMITDKNDGYAVAFNWMKEKWTLVSDFDGYSGVSVGNTFYWIDKSDNLNHTVQDNFADNTEFYPLRLDTGWFSFAGLGGFQRVWKLLIIGQNLDDHKLRVKIAYDGDAYWTDDSVYTATVLTKFGLAKYYDAGLGSAGEDQAYFVEVPTSRQKCSSIRISVEDQDSGSGASEGMAITAVAFEVGIREGTKITGDTRTNTGG